MRGVAEALDDLPSGVIRELTKGIANPSPVKLRPPLRLYRFTDKARGPLGGMVGPWWITENDFRKILDARERSRKAHGGDTSAALSLGFLARWAVAVPQEWQEDGRPIVRTTMDMLVVGDLRRPVAAFVGRGGRQDEVAPNGITMHWSGWPTITQIYIPSLSRAQPATPTFADVDAIMAPGPATYFVSRQLYER